MRSSSIIIYFGCVYLVLGISFIALGEQMLNSNLNFELLIPIINGVTVSSFLFGISDAIEQVFLNNRFTISLQSVLSDDFSDLTELDVYKRIEDAYKNSKLISSKYHHINKLYQPLRNLSISLSIWALPIGFVIIMIYLSLDIYMSTGVTLLVFGLFIISYASREHKLVIQQNTTKEIWIKYYKSKSKEE